MNNKKLGFEDDLMRQAGQSLDEQILDLLFDKVFVYISAASMGFIIICTVWIDRFMDSDPIILTIFGFAIMGYSIYKLRKTYPVLQRLRQGRDGERYVGQLLEKLRIEKNNIFHDVIGPSFNLDHVIIGPKGIYIVETKTWNKVAKGADIKYQNGTFFLNGQAMEKNPVIQAQASARWLSNLLKEGTGKGHSVKPIITMPSWFVDTQTQKMFEGENVYLLNPKAIEAVLRGKPVILNSDEIQKVSFSLTVYNKSKKQ